MKCLVTGGAGFIGSNIVLELQKDNDVTVIDNLSTGHPNNLKGYNGGILDIDVSQPFELDEKFDVIFHQAAITDPRFPDDKEILRANLEGFKNMVELAKKNKAKLIYASSANLYGNGPIPMKEDQEKDIISAYGKSKLEIDRIAETLKDKMHIVGLRYFNVFGPREQNKGRAASMVYHLSNQIKSNKNPRIFKYGEQKRDHIYVKDAVTATIKAINAPSGIYNIGTGIATSFNDLIKILNEVLGTNKQPEYFDMPYEPETYQANTQADTRLARKKLKFKAHYTLKEGIKKYMGYMEEHTGNKDKFLLEHYKNLGNRRYDFRGINLVKWIVSKIEGTSILDIGCGDGFLINMLNKKGKKAFGVEPNKELVKLAKKINPEVSIIENKIENIGNIKKVDAITIIDVLEHIENDKNQFKKICSLLKKRGQLIIVVPAFQSLYGKRDKKLGHYRRYSKKDLRILLKNGFTVKKIRYWNMLGFFPYLFCEKILKKGLETDLRTGTKKGIFKKVINKLINYWFRYIENSINLGFGLSLICVAVKK